MADNDVHYTPLPESMNIDETSVHSEKKTGMSIPMIVVGMLIVIVLILGAYYYLTVLSIPPQQAIPEQTSPEPTLTSDVPSSDEVQLFDIDDAGTQDLACLDWQKYKARLDQIGMVCTAGCCPWTGGTGQGCSAPADGECKPKANPCSDGTCWECRFEREGLRWIRYQGNEWVSCSTQPTPTPTVQPVAKCEHPNQCLPLDECETPPSAVSPNVQCANSLYCCKPKTKVTPPGPTLSCIKPEVEVEVQCLQCDGEASTQ